MDIFVESYDFDGITMIPFCTSSSSGIGMSGKNLESNAGSGNWLDGERFGEGASEEDKKLVADLVDEIREYYKNVINNSEWLSETTKEEALKKLNKILIMGCESANEKRHQVRSQQKNITL